MHRNVSEDFISVLNRESRTFRSRITIDDDTISDIKSYVLTSGSCGSENFSIGTVFSSYVDLVFPQINDITFAGKEFLLETGLLLDNETVEYIPMGYYTAGPSDLIKSRDQITVKASDRITSKCNKIYIPSITFPATIQVVLNDLASQAGVTIATSFNVSGQIETAFSLLRISEVLGYIAGLLGGFCYADRMGSIRIEPFPNLSGLTVEKDRITALSVAESEYVLNRISVIVREGGENADGEEVEDISYSSGSGEGIDLFNPYMTQSLFSNLSSRVLGYTFFPGTVSFLGDPRLDPIDAILAENYAGAEFLMPCMSLQQVFDGGLQTTITAPGMVASDQAAQGPLSQQVDKLAADMVLTKEVVAKKITADEADIRYGTIEKAVIGTGSADDFSAAKLSFLEAAGRIFSADQLTALSAAFDSATAGTISADDIQAVRAEFESLLAGSFTAVEIAAAAAEFKTAVVSQLYVNSLRAGYAEIDFANVTTEAVKNLFVNVGMIENATIHEGRITGTLSGVTVVADVIEANAIVTGDLIVQDSENEGTYYKINPAASGLTIDELEALEYDKFVSGQYIVAKSITADQVAVTELAAFGATIAGLQLENGKIYTAGKSTAGSQAPGIYMDSRGQFVTGSDYNFIASWYDTEAQKWKIAIRADEISFGTGESVVEVITNAAEAVENMQERMDSGEFKGEDAVVLRINSSRGTVFKNNTASTVLTVVIYSGGQRITDITALRAKFGSGAYLQWYWRHLDDDRYGVISADDHKLSDSGFTLTITADEVDTNVTFLCELVL